MDPVLVPPPPTALHAPPDPTIDAFALMHGKHGYLTALSFDDRGHPVPVLLEVRQLDFGDMSYHPREASAIPSEMRDAYRKAIYETSPGARLAFVERAAYNVPVNPERGWVDRDDPDCARIVALPYLGHVRA